MPNEPPIVISVSDLVVGFGRRVILDRLSLDVLRGEVIGVVGASGSGKSVLLRTILGLIEKRQGSITILGIDRDAANSDQLRQIGRRCGVLFQYGALFSSLTVVENVEFPMREHLGLPPGLRHDVAMAKIEMVGLKPDDALKYPAELSGGMTKRAALARALALDPEIVFLDEPTSGLDPISAEAFDSLIRTLRRTLGLTVYMNTHDLDTLATVCDRIAALADGRVAALGTMSDMRNCGHPWVREYFGGTRAHLAARGSEVTAVT